jgi:hypothetical protein
MYQFIPITSEQAGHAETPLKCLQLECAQKEKNMLQVMGSVGATGVSFRKEESVPREDGSGGYRLSCGN